MAGRLLSTLDAPVGAEAVRAALPLLEAALTGSGPALLLLPDRPPAVRRRLLAAARSEEPLERDDVALVVPTSGTTGPPRLALLTRDALTASATATADRLGGAGGYVLALPTTFVAGVMVLVRSVLAGAEPEVVDLGHGFSPAAFTDAVQRLHARPPAGPRHTALVPTQLARLLDAGGPATAALASLDAVLVGGAATAATLLERARVAGVPVVTTYGMTETCGGCVYDGAPLPGTEVRLDDAGRIHLTGPTLFAGYRRRPDLTGQTLVDGWLRTPDLGHLDDSGRLHIDGRIDDVVVSGGVNVSPHAVEAALATHPKVADVAVVGVPDLDWGQRVVAVVEAVPAGAPTLDELRDHTRDVLAPASWPQGLLVVAKLPRLPSGKPDRTAVRTLAAAAPHQV